VAAVSALRLTPLAIAFEYSNEGATSSMECLRLRNDETQIFLYSSQATQLSSDYPNQVRSEV
jgi:hypothetical protein